MPGSKVVTICGAELPGPGKPNKDALREIKELKRAVKAGEVIGFGAVCIHKDRSASLKGGGFIGGYGVLGASVILTSRLQGIVDPE